MDTHKADKIRSILRDWYEMNKRTLPWRDTTEAYKIWISEIILQQTRVEQGFDYYLRFVERFPDAMSLAVADEQEVLRYWQGLGYYSRARNLHRAAKIIAEQFGGQFPRQYHEVRALPGIGAYTAAAVCSFAYNLPYAAVDGNIFRVLARLTANFTPIDTEKGRKIFTDTAHILLDKQEPGAHNQAVMEFGAIRCTPRQPACTDCPLTDYCEAYNRGIVSELPVKQGRTAVTHRYFNYFFVRHGEHIYLQKRTKKDIWRNLYELPLIETDEPIAPETIAETVRFREMFGACRIELGTTPRRYKHVLTHRIIHAVFYEVSIRSGESELLLQCEKVALSDLDRYPVSRLTELFLQQRTGVGE